MLTIAKEFCCLFMIATVLGTVSAPTKADAEWANSLSPPATDDGWDVGNAVRAGFDRPSMVELAKDLADDHYSNVHSVLVEHDGKLIFEQYLSGTDSRWGRPTGPTTFHRDSLHDLRSITKSVTSLLLGIALKQDFGAALDRPVASYLPDIKALAARDKKAITLRHVLTMASGLRWNEVTVPYSNGSNDAIKMYSADNAAEYALARPMREPAGTRWYYNGGLTMVTAEVVQEMTDESFVQYAHDALFEPLNIRNFKWYGPKRWRARGMPSAASGLRLRARDLAKIGSLVLHGGRWKGRQIVPEEWVRQSIQRHRNDTAPWSAGGIYGYGLHWWHGNFQASGKQFTAITGMGHGGQRLFILPAEKIVVTIFSGNYNSQDWWKSERILKRIVAAKR